MVTFLTAVLFLGMIVTFALSARYGVMDHSYEGCDPTARTP